MHAPQITMIALITLGIGATMAKHGQPKTEEHNVFVSLAGAVLTAGILWWGGFWS